MKNDRFKDYDDEVRDLVLDFERTVMKGQMQFFDIDELEMIIDYYLEVDDRKPLEKAVVYAERLYPDSIEVKIRRAHLAIANHEYQSALNQLLALHSKEPENTDLAYSLGVVYSAMERHDEAVAQFLAASADGWQLGRIYGNIAEEYVKKNDLVKALKYYEAALKNEDNDTSSLYNYVDTCERTGTVAHGITKLEEYVNKHPYSREGWFCLGLLYMDMTESNKAIDALEYALAIDGSSVETYAELAFAYEISGDTGRAASILLQMAEKTGHRVEAYRSIGSIYSNIGNFKAAEIYFHKALLEAPEDTLTLVAIADNSLRQGDTSMALTYLRKAKNEGENGSEFHHIAALVYDNLDNTEVAMDHYESMIETGTYNENQCRDYVEFLFRHKMFDVMIPFCEESLDYFPQDAYYNTMLAAAYFYTNRYNSARKALQYAVPSQLALLCPEIMTHPLLGPLINNDER